MKRRAQFLQWTHPFLLKDLIQRNGIDHEKIYLLLNELDSYKKNFNTDRKKQTNKQTGKQIIKTYAIFFETLSWN